MTSNLAAAVAVFDLAKSFGATVALSRLNLSVRRGEVVALMGANGAGKSTLVRILSGSESPDAGRIEIDGMRVEVRSPQHAKALGIATVHQQTAQAGAPGLTVAENLLLDAFCDGRAGVWARPATIRRRAAAIAGLLGVELPLDRDFAEISTAQKQLVAIARAVAAKSSVLILDEPTSTLSAAELQRLFGIIDQVRSAGMAVLYISHRIADLARVADRVVVLRGGQVASALEKPIDFRAAVSAMIGRPIEIGAAGA